MSAQDIADELDVSDSFVHQAIRELGIPKGGRKGYTAEDVGRIREWIAKRPRM